MYQDIDRSRKKERGDRKEAGDEKKFRAQTQVDSPIAQLVRALH